MLAMPTPRAVLGSIGRVNFHQLATSFLRFVRKLREELRPCRIQDALGEAVVMNHTAGMDVFNSDYAEAIDYLPGKLVREVVMLPGNAFVNPGNDFALSFIFPCPFL